MAPPGSLVFHNKELISNFGVLRGQSADSCVTLFESTADHKTRRLSCIVRPNHVFVWGCLLGAYCLGNRDGAGCWSPSRKE